MIKKIGILLLVAACSAVMAEDWVSVSTSDNNEYFGLKGSVIVRTNKSGEEIIIMTGKNNDNRSKTITVEKIYVRTEHCLKKQGKGVVLTLDSDFKYEYDFIFGAGSIGSTKAEFICDVYKYQQEEKNKKGI